MKISTDSSQFCQINDPRILLSIDYTTEDNFIGRPIEGYKDKVCLLTKEAAQSLVKAQDALDKTYGNLCFKIFDSYRPQMAVDEFKSWVEDDPCEKMKDLYYPDISKKEMVKLGYLGIDRSTHTRGSTIDLTLCKKNGESIEELDMGSRFDFFSQISHTQSNKITAEQKKNRELLCSVMAKHGFENFPMEWWHFTLANEPFPDTYFNFPVQRNICLSLG